ncbi:beta-lactamase regulator AmpE [Paraglaciecola aestuariivivens]
MTLISLLLVLFLERVSTQNQYWQASFYVDKYISGIESRGWFNAKSSSWLVIVLTLVPVFLVYLLVQKFSGGLIELLLSTAILMVCIGCPAIRETYKCFLQAANRGDLTACGLYEQQITESDQDNYSFGLNLVWQNYRHYTAVILWFAVFGAAGAVLYVLVRELASKLPDDNAQANAQINSVLHILDWVPVRITALGFLLVGHFSRAFSSWLNYFPDPSVSAKTLLLAVSKQAEEVEPDQQDCTEEPCTLVRLAKRNVLLLLVVIAILTLSGWIN